MPPPAEQLSSLERTHSGAVRAASGRHCAPSTACGLSLSREHPLQALGGLLTWTVQPRDLSDRLRTEHVTDPLPVVIAGVQHSVRKFAPNLTETIGVIPGNHDRSSATELHHAAWPIVNDWLRTDAIRAMRQFDLARSDKRYAGGIHEI